MSRRVLFFTDPYPDEIISSAVSRFRHCYKGFSNGRSMEELFGKTNVEPNPLFVGLLAELSSRLGDEYSPDGIIQKHTIFPFFAPFISDSLKERILSLMLNSDVSFNHLLGIKRSNYGYNPVRLRFCPVCKELDYQKYQTVFFHVHHQLPGIDVCLDHQTWLEDFPIPFWQNYQQYIWPDYERMNVEPRYCQCQVELELAESAYQVFSNYSLSQNSSDVLKRLDQTFRQRGFLKNKMNFKKLYQDLQDYYTEDYLKRKNCYLSPENLYSRDNWLTNCSVNRHRYPITPYKCLLLIDFLYEDYNTFLYETEFLEDGEKEEWTCINPACPNYGTDTSTHVTYYNERGSSSVRIECSSCRMIYSSKVQRTFPPTILQYGNLWFEKLKQLKNEGLSNLKIGRIMNVSENTVASMLKKAGNFTPVDNRKYQARHELRSLLKENPNLKRVELQENFGSTYRILKNYDSEWLNSVLPPSDKTKGSKTLTNLQKDPDYYNKLDDKYLAICKKIYQKLLEVDPPVIITKNCFYNNLDISTRLIRKLPRTSQFISEKREDGKAFSIRLGKYYVDYFISNRIHVSRNKLRNKGVSKIYEPEVSEIVMAYYENRMNNYSFFEDF